MLGGLRLRLAGGALLLLAVLALWVGKHAATALVVARDVNDPDAIVSLASHEWERLPTTVRLAAQFPRALILLTLPQSVSVYNCHDCDRRADRLTRAGVVPERIRILPLTAPGTHGEALAVRDFARASPIKRLLVVTSLYHTRRALATFRYVMGETVSDVGIADARETDPPPQPERWWAAPYDRGYVRYEWAASVYYWLRFGVPIGVS